MMGEMTTYGVDMYARITEPSGRSTLIHTRTWDKELFVRTRTEDAVRENSKQREGEPRLAKFEQITEAQYVAGRKK